MAQSLGLHLVLFAVLCFEISDSASNLEDDLRGGVHVLERLFGGWLSRKETVKQFPLRIQKAFVVQLLQYKDMELTSDVPSALNSWIPDIIESFVNGAIDQFIVEHPGLKHILNKGISGGTALLENRFGGSECPKPPKPRSVESWKCTRRYDYKSVCVIKCAPGYGLAPNSSHEQARITCRSDRTWTRIPVCKDVAAPVITNCPGYTRVNADRSEKTAVIVWPAIQAKDSSNVTVRQTRGEPSGSRFSEGSHKVVYEAEDSMGLTDTCVFYVNVKVFRCAPPQISSEDMEITCPNEHLYGAVCTLSCLHQLQLEGSSMMTCEKVGHHMEWQYLQGPPKCLVMQCSYPEESSEDIRFTCKDLRKHGVVCDVSCFPGLVLEGSPRITCLKKGNQMEWQYPLGPPKCLDGVPPPAELTDSVVKNLKSFPALIQVIKQLMEETLQLFGNSQQQVGEIEYE